MQTKETKRVIERLVNNDQNETRNNSFDSIQNVNPQVKAVKTRAPKRKFSQSDKLKYLQSFDECTNPTERASFLRKNRLYYASITKWKAELSGQKTNHANSKAYKAMLENNQLQRENARLKKQLAQAEAIIEIQKKVSALLSMNDLNQNMSEEK